MLSWLWSDPLPVGTKAPPFTLADEAGNQVSLARLKGKNVVLVFYPADDTAVCTKQLCEFRDRWKLVVEKNATVFGVNPAKPSTHASFRTKHGFPFALLVDEGQKLGPAHH